MKNNKYDELFNAKIAMCTFCEIEDLSVCERCVVSHLTESCKSEEVSWIDELDCAMVCDCPSENKGYVADLSREDYDKICDARTALCNSCEHNNTSECEHCIVSRLVSDAYIECREIK